MQVKAMQQALTCSWQACVISHADAVHVHEDTMKLMTPDNTA
jgi:hypothetical protein